MLFSKQLEVRSHEIVIPLQSQWTEYMDEAIEKWSAVLQLSTLRGTNSSINWVANVSFKNHAMEASICPLLRSLIF